VAEPLPTPGPGPEAARAWVADHLGHLTAEPAGRIRPSPRFRGGQQAADAALAAFDVTGYARRRNEVWPVGRRGASALSPWVRHGLLPLRTVWEHVAQGPPEDVRRFRDELLWQEFARHAYARLGTRTGRSLRYTVPERTTPAPPPDAVWDPRMACLDLASQELLEDGWVTNQTRLWLASHWSVRGQWGWRDGEDHFFRHLLDGSRAANRLGWQWTVGAGTGRPYGFSRWNVRARAPGLCDSCALASACPVEDRPPERPLASAPPAPLLRTDPAPSETAGPDRPIGAGRPSVVWLTAESLGDADPALTAHPRLPVIFVFDEPLLTRLRLSGKRLVFLTETLAALAARRELQVLLGSPVEVMTDRRPAVTFAPVPGFRRSLERLDVAALHPWPWLVRPHGGPVTSFSAWRRSSS
jgi:deoxyribodipyrimidine photo-lyase